MDNEINTSGGASISGHINTADGDFVGRDKIAIQLASLSDGVLRTLFSSFQGLQANNLVNRQVLFQQYIEPVFNKLELVHKDYEKTLLELSYQLESGERKPRELLRWLYEKSLLYKSEREYLKSINVELDILLPRLIDAGSNENESTILVEAIKGFSLAVVNYFNFSYVDSLDKEPLSYKFVQKPVGRPMSSGYHTVTVNLEEYVDEIERNTSYAKSLSLQDRFKMVLKGRVPKRESPFIDEFSHLIRHAVFSPISYRWVEVTNLYLKLRGICLDVSDNRNMYHLVTKKDDKK